MHTSNAEGTRAAVHHLTWISNDVSLGAGVPYGQPFVVGVPKNRADFFVWDEVHRVCPEEPVGERVGQSKVGGYEPTVAAMRSHHVLSVCRESICSGYTTPDEHYQNDGQSAVLEAAVGLIVQLDKTATCHRKELSGEDDKDGERKAKEPSGPILYEQVRPNDVETRKLRLGIDGVEVVEPAPRGPNAFGIDRAGHLKEEVGNRRKRRMGRVDQKHRGVQAGEEHDRDKELDQRPDLTLGLGGPVVSGGGRDPCIGRRVRGHGPRTSCRRRRQRGESWREHVAHAAVAPVVHVGRSIGFDRSHGTRSGRTRRNDAADYPGPSTVKIERQPLTERTKISARRHVQHPIGGVKDAAGFDTCLRLLRWHLEVHTEVGPVGDSLGTDGGTHGDLDA